MAGRVPVLTTKRLRFDRWIEDDFDDLYALHADPLVQPSYGPGPEKWTRAGIADRLATYLAEQDEQGFTKWRLGLADGTFIGRGGWSPWAAGTLELGYAVVPGQWGHGYASEAALALVDWGRANRPRDRLVGFALTHNAASRAILLKIGMAFVDYREIAGVENAYYALPNPA